MNICIPNCIKNIDICTYPTINIIKYKINIYNYTTTINK